MEASTNTTRDLRVAVRKRLERTYGANAKGCTLSESTYGLILSIAARIDNIAASEARDFHMLEVILSEASAAITNIRARAAMAAVRTTETNI